MFEALGQRLRAYAEKDGRGYPDWATRYVPVVKRLRRRALHTSTILEIGANANGFARFAKERVVVVDIDKAHLQEARAVQDVLPVVADAGRLPFGPQSVDVCVCVDTFEHLSADARDQAVAEIVRALRSTGTAVLAFPDGARAARAEERINAEYRQMTGRAIAWLEQHAAGHLPDADAVVRRLTDLARATHRVSRVKNASLWVWVWMWRVLMCGWPGRGNALFQALLRLGTPVLCRMHFGTCYRTMIWLEPTEGP